MSISGETAVRLKMALGSEASAKELVEAINAASGGDPGAGVELPQPLAPTDSPTFADLMLSGVLKVAGVDVVGSQQPEIPVPVFTATTGALPTSDGATTIADAVLPTVEELLDAVVELQVVVATVVDTLQTHGLVASAGVRSAPPEHKRSHHKHHE